MNKVELIEAIAKESGLEKKQSEKALNAFVEVITGTVAKGEKVQLIGFGTFEQRERNARVGRDPRSGEEINIAACKVPAFKVGKNFKEAVAGN